VLKRDVKIGKNTGVLTAEVQNGKGKVIRMDIEEPDPKGSP
jgi:hypothetical protein